MNEHIISRNGSDYPFPSLFPTSFQDSFESLFSELESAFSSPFIKKSFPYPMDIQIFYDKKTNEPRQYLIEIALAGFSKDEIKVKIVQNKTLKIDIIPANIQDYNDDKYIEYPKYLSHGIAKREASYSWTIGPRIDTKNMLLHYQDGILSIALPIVKEEKNDNEIEIPIA